jgi:hypothetical protein
MRFLVVLVSLGAALTLIAASGLMNWVFMTSLGKSDLDRHVLGGVSVAVSIFIALLPTHLVWAWRERRPFYVAVGMPVFLAFAAFSLSSAIGFASRNRGSLDEDRRLVTTRLVDVKSEIESGETALKALEAVRSFAVVQESLRGLEQDRRWQSSKGCEAATVDASRSFCKDYFELKAEAAKAGERDRLMERIAELKRERGRLEDEGAGREADNQAAVLARLLGMPATEVERGLTLYLAVLVEIGAALGIYVATGHMRPRLQRYDDERRENRVIVIEAAAVGSARENKAVPAPLKQIAAPVGQPGPRRVPHIKQA